LITTITSSLTMTIGDQPLGIGRQGGNTGTGNGYIDDVRVINGHALYTEAFTPPTSAVGSAVESGGVTTNVVDNKFLSSVWDSDDVSEKMADGTWIRNDSDTGGATVIKGAGLEVSGHRWYNAPSAPPELSFDVLVAAGGAGGGYRDAGGGGGGGVITWTPITSSSGTAFPVTIGSGGGGSTGTNSRGTSGGNSVFGSPSVPTILTAIGGGGGASSAATTGLPGGSGGGGARGGSGGGNTPGQGQPGGYGSPGGGNIMGGGGGGYTSAGNASGPGYGGTGYSVPAGLQANPTFGPSHTVISSGGGAGKEAGASGAPGGTGAGNGGDPTPAPERDASSYGSGGGGAGNNSTGGDGKDGVVVIRHTSPVGPSGATGGTISSHPDGYIYHVFTSPGTFTIA